MCVLVLRDIDFNPKDKFGYYWNIVKTNRLHDHVESLFPLLHYNKQPAHQPTNNNHRRFHVNDIDDDQIDRLAHSRSSDAYKQQRRASFPLQQHRQFDAQSSSNASQQAPAPQRFKKRSQRDNDRFVDDLGGHRQYKRPRH